MKLKIENKSKYSFEYLLSHKTPIAATVIAANTTVLVEEPVANYQEVLEAWLGPEHLVVEEVDDKFELKEQKKEPVKVTSVVISPETLEIKIGEVAKFEASFLPADAVAEELNWSITGGQATSGKDGEYTGNKPGEYTVTASLKSDKNIKATAKLVVVEVKEETPPPAEQKPEETK